MIKKMSIVRHQELQFASYNQPAVSAVPYRHDWQATSTVCGRSQLRIDSGAVCRATEEPLLRKTYHMHQRTEYRKYRVILANVMSVLKN